MTNKLLLRVSIRETAEVLEALRRVLSYDPETGVLRWTKRTANRIKIGDVAGTPTTSGYLALKYLGKGYQAHRICWALHHGRWPMGLLDHKSRVRNQNNATNLREATPAQSCANRSTWGAVPQRGVRKKKGRFVAQIKINGNQFHIGSFGDAESAAAAFDVVWRATYGTFCAE